MKLIGAISILFGDKLITEQILELYRDKWKNRAICPGKGAVDMVEETVLHALLYELTPLTIVADENSKPLILKALLKRFPYSIDGKENFAAFGLRLVPVQGRIKQIDMDPYMNPRSSVAISNISINTELLSVDFGNESLHLEIFFQSQPNDLLLKELEPPTGFEKIRKTSSD